MINNINNTIANDTNNINNVEVEIVPEHIINDIVDDDVYLAAKELFDGKEIVVKYDAELIRSNHKGHWWLKAECDDAQNIRNVMGIGNPYFGYHITIGLATHLQLEHSKYITQQCIKFNL